MYFYPHQTEKVIRMRTENCQQVGTNGGEKIHKINGCNFKIKILTPKYSEILLHRLDNLG